MQSPRILRMNLLLSLVYNYHERRAITSSTIACTILQSSVFDMMCVMMK